MKKPQPNLGSKPPDLASDVLAQENRIRALFDTVVDGIVVIDSHGLVQTLNPAAIALFGYTAAEVEGQNIKMLMPQPYASEHDGYLHNYLSTGAKKVIGIGREVIGRRKDGSTFPMELAVSEMDVNGARMFTGIVRDISERKRVEAGIVARELQFRALVDSLLDAIVLMDANGLIQTMNTAAVSLFGYEQDQALGQSIRRLVPQPYEGASHGDLTVDPTKLVGIRGEVVGVRQDGLTFPMDWAVNAMEVHGELMFTGIARDITERKNTEGIQAQFFAIVESSSDAIVSETLEGVVSSWNAGAEKMFGYSDFDMLGQPLSLLNPDGYADDQSYILEKIKLGEGLDGYQTVRRRKNGEIFPVSVTISPIRNFSGVIIGASNVARDITELKKQQETLKTSEETFRSAMEHAPIGMALVSIEGHWLQVNQSLCDLLGYSRDVLQSNDFQSISYPDDLPAELEFVKQVLAGELKTYQIEKRFYHETSRLVWVQLSMSLVRQEDGTPNYFIAQIADITDRLAMERMKSEFVSIVSHELRTPLTSIRGSLGLIVGALRSEVSDKAGRLIEIAHSNCERLILLINDILDIDKIASGQMRFDKKEEYLAPIVRQSIEGNQSYAEKFGVSIALGELDESLKVNVDVGRLMQVLANFLSNAAKFSPRGGVVEVIVTRHGSHARVSISDHGPGISDEFKPRIFGKFMQADSTVTRSKGGTGLGLHISKQIVEHMGGKVDFDSEVGKGSTFWLELPIVHKKEPEIMSFTVPERREKILLCEGSEEAASTIQLMLKAYDVEVACSLVQARGMIREGLYSVMILASCLPDGPGMELVRELRLGRAARLMPIIIVSTSEMVLQDHVDIFGGGLGIQNWLVKPFCEGDLIRAVRRVLEPGNALPRVLHIEDDIDLSHVLAVALQGKAEIFNTPNIQKAEQCLRQQSWEMILLDLGLPDGSGMILLDRLASMGAAGTPVVILTGTEVSDEVRGRVDAVMVKSRMSEAFVAQTILSHLLPSADVGKTQV